MLVSQKMNNSNNKPIDFLRKIDLYLVLHRVLSMIGCTFDIVSVRARVLLKLNSVNHLIFQFIRV